MLASFGVRRFLASGQSHVPARLYNEKPMPTPMMRPMRMPTARPIQSHILPIVARPAFVANWIATPYKRGAR